MAVEFRGCKNLVFAEVTKDNNSTESGEGYVTGTVTTLAPVAEISKSVDTNSAAHYYDNQAAVIIDSEGADTVTFTIAVPTDAVLAKLTGRTYDSTKKMFIESEREQKYFAVGYILGETGSDERYVWRYKGTFNIPDETAKTEDDGTDAENMSLEFTGIYTEHIFTNGKGANTEGTAKAAYVRSSDLPTNCTKAKWFNTVSTPDTTWTA